MDRKRTAFDAWLCVMLAASTVQPMSATGADTLDGLSEKEFLADVPVVLTASRLGQSASDAPNAVTVIDRDLIRATGAREIADVLRLVPGMYVTYVTYVRGLQALVSYHGVATEFPNHMQVLVDGRAIYNPTLGEVSWTNLPLTVEDIERIEVVRGPSAATHGANSFFGVINIITRHAADDRGLHATVSHGTHAIDDRLVRYAGKAGALDYRITAAYRSDDTYDIVADDRRVRLATLRADYRLTNRDTLHFQAGYNGGKRETQAPPAVQPDPIDYPRNIGINNRFQQFQWIRALDDGGELSLQLYHNYLGVSDISLSQPLPISGAPRLAIDDSIRAHRYNVELQHTVNAQPGLRWVWGGSWRYESSDAPLSFSAPVGNHSQRLFGHAEWQVAPRWLVNAGAMVERTDFTGADVSPRVALNFRIAPRHTLRASFSRALRNPTLVEEKVDRKYVLGPILVQRFLASGNLRPERIVSRDVGYVGEIPGAGLTVDVRLFNDRLSDLIREVLVPFPASLDGITRDFRNLSDLRQTGFETQVRWRPTRGTQVGLAQSHVINSSSDAAIARSTPKNTYSTFIVHSFPSGLSGSLMAFHQDRVQALGFSEPQRPINRIDARLAQQFRVGRTRAEVSLVAQNLLNYHYTDFRSENVFDRRLYASLRLDY